MQRVARHPPVLEIAVAVVVDHAREPRLGRLGRRAVSVAGEFVQGKGERERGEGDVEAALHEGVSCG